MEGQELILQNTNRIARFTVRDFAAVAFRRSRTLLYCFFGILLGSLVAAVLLPTYRAETEIMVRRQRVDPVVTAEQTNPMVVSSTVTEEEINSEVELITSEDVPAQGGVGVRARQATPRVGIFAELKRPRTSHRKGSQEPAL